MLVQMLVQILVQILVHMLDGTTFLSWGPWPGSAVSTGKEPCIPVGTQDWPGYREVDDGNTVPHTSRADVERHSFCFLEQPSENQRWLDEAEEPGEHLQDAGNMGKQRKQRSSFFISPEGRVSSQDLMEPSENPVEASTN
ncbi:unnamed protein product [Pleuronectes platessa]|uniref:Uncharacterized protein n=1 Tax=Pleuronectes platessa TaxID=8262 RepID=A0A9N7USF0_PLEPL|nr:unnamed protein product [Pleuronectes platessa]